ncbi:MAG: TIM barrel protein [Oscillospiraceae bacterium]|nr:TIM barrel protein [Oscillospiraceae bacterium]
MKILTNLIANKDCLGDYCDREKLNNFLTETSLDGYEVICAGDYPQEIDNSKVVGVHLPFFNAWMDLYNGDFDALDKEYGGRDVWQQFYGGDSFDAVYRQIESQLDFAQQIDAEYVVMHVVEIGTTETLTGQFKYSHKEVISALCDVANRLFRNKNYTFALLLENLWWQGFTFTDAELTKYMLDNIEYPNKGIMLDIGHLMNTDKSLRSWEEAAEYIHKMLDLHSNMLEYVKGVHLHGTLEGEFAQRFYEEGTEIEKDFWKRFAQSYEYVLKVDSHRPFEHESIKGVIEKINPDYLVYEFSDRTMENRKVSVKKQNNMWR